MARSFQSGKREDLRLRSTNAEATNTSAISVGQTSGGCSGALSLQTAVDAFVYSVMRLSVDLSVDTGCCCVRDGWSGRDRLPSICAFLVMFVGPKICCCGST